MKKQHTFFSIITLFYIFISKLNTAIFCRASSVPWWPENHCSIPRDIPKNINNDNYYYVFCQGHTILMYCSSTLNYHVNYLVSRSFASVQQLAVRRKPGIISSPQHPEVFTCAVCVCVVRVTVKIHSLICILLLANVTESDAQRQRNGQCHLIDLTK